MYFNLITEMKKKKITNIQLAELLQCRVATISDKMNGKTGCGFYFEEAKRIKNVFFKEFDIEWLFEREN